MQKIERIELKLVKVVKYSLGGLKWHTSVEVMDLMHWKSVLIVIDSEHVLVQIIDFLKESSMLLMSIFSKKGASQIGQLTRILVMVPNKS